MSLDARSLHIPFFLYDQNHESSSNLKRKHQVMDMWCHNGGLCAISIMTVVVHQANNCLLLLQRGANIWTDEAKMWAYGEYKGTHLEGGNLVQKRRPEKDEDSGMELGQWQLA